MKDLDERERERQSMFKNIPDGDQHINRQGKQKVKSV